MTWNAPSDIRARLFDSRGIYSKVIAATGLIVLSLVPVQSTLAQQPDTIEAGRQQFEDKCAVCHGASATGDGTLAADMNPKPADLTGISARNDGTFPTEDTFQKVWGRGTEIISTHVMTEMPAFYDAPVFGHDEDFESSAGRLSAKQIKNIISYLETIQKQ